MAKEDKNIEDTGDELKDLKSIDEVENEKFVDEISEEVAEETESVEPEGLNEERPEEFEPEAEVEEVNEEELAPTEDKTEEELQTEINKSQTVEEAMESTAETQPDHFKPDPDTDKAVDDIVRTESDEVIAQTDAKIAALQETKNKKSLKQKIAGFFAAWWNNLPARYGTIAGLFVLAVLVVFLPVTRYATLNLFGVRVNSSLTVIDSQTRLPLKNINVTLQDKTAITDSEGNVAFSELKLGSSQLTITKRGYADNSKTLTLGWGSNPLGEQELLATGERFTFVLSDWQTGEPLTKAEATAGENSAVADDKGKIILTVGEENISAVTVEISGEGYRTETLTSDQLPDDELAIKMVPSKQHVFVSNRNGQYDLYKIYVDSEYEELLLGATKQEREVPYVLPHPTKNLVAFVSSREGDTNQEGFVLDGLFIIDVDSGESNRIARSEQLQLIGWSGDKLVFWQVVEGTSRANPERSKIISYDTQSSERKDLAAANYFNDVKLVGDTVFYAVSSYAVPQSQAKLYRVSVNGEDPTKLLDKQAWGIYRTAHNRLLFNAEDQKWYERVNDGLIEEVANQTNPQDINFVDSPDGKHTAWVEIRDGKGVLLVADTEKLEEQQIVNMPGLNSALYWANNTSLVFRVVSNSETADYMVDITKKEPRKIVDVTATQNLYY